MEAGYRQGMLHIEYWVDANNSSLTELEAKCMSGFSIGCVALMSIIILSIKSMLDAQCALATYNADENKYYTSLIERD